MTHLSLRQSVSVLWLVVTGATLLSLSFTSVIAFLQSSNSAAASVTTIESAVVVVGDEVTLSVTADNSMDGMDIYVTYDDQLLYASRCTGAAVCGVNSGVHGETPNRAYFGYFRETPPMTLTFIGIAPGVSPLTLTGNCFIWEPSVPDGEVPCTFQDSSVKVVVATPTPSPQPTAAPYTPPPITVAPSPTATVPGVTNVTAKPSSTAVITPANPSSSGSGSTPSPASSTLVQSVDFAGQPGAAPINGEEGTTSINWAIVGTLGVAVVAGGAIAAGVAARSLRKRDRQGR